MARTGSFGRLPRSQPSLTATLVSIAKQMQSQEDQNMMDAWQKGGSIDGKKVTDEMMLAYWHQRLQGISTDDPLYATYSNAIQQYEYTIAESKMTAKYALIPAPKAADDKAMAAFYLGWAKKIPNDSEFYRVLQRDAGQYIRSAAAKNSANAAANAEKAYQAQQLALQTKGSTAGDNVLTVLTNLGQSGSGAQNAGSLQQKNLGAPTDIVGTSNLGDLQLPGVEDMLGLLSTISLPVHGNAAGGASSAGAGLGGNRAVTGYVGNPNVIYTDGNGQSWTGAQILAQAKAADPSFDGNYNLSYIQNALTQQEATIRQQIALAKKTGHLSDVSSLTQALQTVNAHRLQVEAYPVLNRYADLESQYQSLSDDSSILPPAKQLMLRQVLAQIGDLANDPTIADNDILRSKFTGEASGTIGTVTAAEDISGSTQGNTAAQGKPTDTVAQEQATLAQLDAVTKALGDGSTGMVLTQGSYTGPPDPTTGAATFVPSAGGTAWGAYNIDDLQKLPGAAGAAVPVMQPTGVGSAMQLTYILPVPVTTTATDATGNKVTPAPGTNAQVGLALVMNWGGVPTTLFQVKDPTTGIITYQKDSPGGPKSTFITGKAGVVVNVSASVPKGTGKNGDLGGGFSTTGVTATNPVGTTHYDPGAVIAAADPVRAMGVVAYDVASDSFSPTLMGLKGHPDASQFIAANGGLPAFKSLVTYDAHTSAGQTLTPGADPSDPASWTGGYVNAQGNSAFDTFNSMAQFELGAAANPNFVHSIQYRDTWEKDIIPPNQLGQYAPAPVTAAGQTAAQRASTYGAVTTGTNLLPTTTLLGDPNNQMSALSNGVQPGSNQFAQPTQKGVGTLLKLPTVAAPNVNANTGFVLPTQAAPPSAYVPPADTNKGESYGTSYGTQGSGSGGGTAYGGGQPGPKPV